ncbi:MAG TPA: substrate-binding domain-containing protein [Thermomicrobiales bacterium]|nr:substrate-binding domain-containing protein [Thermomicrobiales bacterium]
MSHRFSRVTRLPRGVVVLFAAMLAISSLSMAATAQDATPGATSDSPFFNQEDYETQLAQRDMEAEGPADQPWIQMIDPEMVDTAEYATDPGWHVCFSNAGVNNPWRATGWTTMQAEVELHEEIETFTHVDAEGDDNKQISDIQDLLNQDCDILIVSPNTTEALTPAVEEACQQLPVIVFDRGVNTDCPVTFIHPIGGYAFGAAGAEFIVEQVPEGGNVLALRILPGVDVLETRWAAADIAFQEAGINVVGVEFSEGDRAQVKSIVTDYIAQYGQIDGVWMDAGQDAVAVIEAFEDLGMDVPPIVGEDQQDFLQAWDEKGLTAVAPTYPNYQWRTPVIAATMILSGEEVPAEWVLPQPTVTQDNLQEYLQPNMPPQHYALCGCEDMPGFPERWGGEPQG